jgi:hypothetical protein
MEPASTKAVAGVEGNSNYSVIACNAPDELSEHLSVARKGEAMHMHGQMFVFKGQRAEVFPRICLADRLSRGGCSQITA